MPVAANNEGRDITIFNSSTGVVTLSGTIDGAVNPTLDSQYDRAVISARGGVWYFKDYRSHGSNSNGSWVKFGDGTMLARYQAPTSSTTTGSTGNINYVTILGLIFPAAFVSIPQVDCFVSPAINGLCWGSDVEDITLSGCIMQLGGSQAISSGYANYIAIGRWK